MTSQANSTATAASCKKPASRGRIPGHRESGEWRFHSLEITHWLEKEIRHFREDELEKVETCYSEAGDAIAICDLLKPELVEVPLPSRTRRSVLVRLGRLMTSWIACGIARIPNRATRRFVRPTRPCSPAS